MKNFLNIETKAKGVWKICLKIDKCACPHPATYDEHHPHVMHAMQKNIKTWGIKVQEGKVETPHNVKLFRTLSMVRQNPQKQTKWKRNDPTGNTTWNPPGSQKKFSCMPIVLKLRWLFAMPIAVQTVQLPN